MTIAVSVVLVPSQFLRRSLLAFAGMLFIAGVYAALVDPLPGVIRFTTVTLSWFASLRLIVYFRKSSNLFWQVDVSELGLIRLHARHFPRLVTSTLGKGSHPEFAPAIASYSGRDRYLIVRAMVWAEVLFLRIQHAADHKSAINIVIFSDMLTPDAFRRLSVACRWIVAHSGTTQLHKVKSHGT